MRTGAGDPPAGVDPVFADGLSFAAGASVSMALVGLALLSLTMLGPNPVILPLVMFECIRGLVGFGQQIGNFGAGHTFGAGFGELRHAGRGSEFRSSCFRGSWAGWHSGSGWSDRGCSRREHVRARVEWSEGV